MGVRPIVWVSFLCIGLFDDGSANVCFLGIIYKIKQLILVQKLIIWGEAWSCLKVEHDRAHHRYKILLPLLMLRANTKV